MRSTFMGLETNKRGLFTQQSALYTTGHNISNANTLGYSRQRVNMQATAGFPGVGLNTPTMPGFLGTGVEAGSIQRIRDSFVDHQFRQESNKLGYWESKSKAISQMEDVLNEPSNYGLQKSLSEFWQSINDLAVNPKNGGARDVVVQRGEAVADSFNYLHSSLTQIQKDIGSEIGIAMEDVNSILDQISKLNGQIAQVEPNGYLPNDLYDTRDNLLDQLSAYFPVKTEKVESGGRALKIAEGTLTVTVTFGGKEIKVVEGSNYAQFRTEGADNKSKTTPSGSPFAGFYLVDGKSAEEGVEKFVDLSLTESQIKGDPITFVKSKDVGKINSLITSFGYEDSNNELKGLYPEMIENLNEMARKFAEKFNEIHRSGYELNSGTHGDNFFMGYTEDRNNPANPYDYSQMTAADIKVNSEIQKKSAKLAASLKPNEEGNGGNAKSLARMQFESLIGESTIQSYFQGVIGKLGVEGQNAAKMAFNSGALLGAVEHRRASISSVSLDEEMTNMIQFQQAYNASARMITVIDETLDKIINGMGVVGR